MNPKSTSTGSVLEHPTRQQAPPASRSEAQDPGLGAGRPGAKPPFALECAGLGKVFRVGFWGRRVVALQDLSLTIPTGEIFGFLGPNGAGKTTTIKILMGLLRPTTGTARILGAPLGEISVRARIGYLPEHPYFYEYLTGEEFLTFYGRLSGLGGSTLRERVSQLLAQVGLKEARSIPLRRYSKGMLQRIGLAQALIHDPELIILDEPMSGLDPLGRRQVKEWILQLRQAGKTLFFSTHILSDVETLCDRVGILVGGRLVWSGSPRHLLGTQADVVEVVLKGGEASRVPEWLRPWAQELEFRAGCWVVMVPEAGLDDLLHQALDHGMHILSATPQRTSLEEYFLHWVQQERCPRP